MIKYSRNLGQVEVIADNGTITTVFVKKTGETKKLLTAQAFLQDEPFVIEKKAKAIVRDLTKEEEAHLATIKTADIFAKSRANYRSGKSGLSSLTK